MDTPISSVLIIQVEPVPPSFSQIYVVLDIMSADLADDAPVQHVDRSSLQRSILLKIS